jgi:hypothetical protein
MGPGCNLTCTGVGTWWCRRSNRGDMRQDYAGRFSNVIGSEMGTHWRFSKRDAAAFAQETGNSHRGTDPGCAAVMAVLLQSRGLWRLPTSTIAMLKRCALTPSG